MEKYGTPDEEGKPKAGNRGKRDSQLILMKFFSNITFNDRLTPLDYELFWKIQRLYGKSPLVFDIVCMVDADTLVKRDSLKRMVFCMERDNRVMGLCGETKVANKTQNWVTWIQASAWRLALRILNSCLSRCTSTILATIWASLGSPFSGE